MEPRNRTVWRRARKQSRMVRDGVSGLRKRKLDDRRDEVVDGVQEKARDSSWGRADSSTDRRSSKLFCGDNGDGNVALASSSGKQFGLVRCGERKMNRKSKGYTEHGLSGHKITGIGDCGVEDAYSVNKEVMDEEGSDARETSETQPSSCVARRTRSQMNKLISGMKKTRANGSEDFILIDDSDNDGDDGDEEEKEEADIIKVEEDMDNYAAAGQTEDQGNKNDLVLNLSEDEEEVKMRHRNIPVAKRTRQQMRMLRDEVFGEGRKLKGKLPGFPMSSPELIDIYDDGSEDDSHIIKLAGAVEENTYDSLGSFAPSGIAHPTGSHVADSNTDMSADGEGAKDSKDLLLMSSAEEEADFLKNKCYLVDEFGNIYSEDEVISTFVTKVEETEPVASKMSSGMKNKRSRVAEDGDEDSEAMIIGGTDEEDSVDRGSREDKANEDHSNEHMSADGEEAKDSEDLLLMCSSEEGKLFLKNKCYLVDKFGNLYSEDEAVSTSFEGGERDKTEARNNSREDWVQILDDNNKDEGVDDYNGDDGVDEREEGDDDGGDGDGDGNSDNDDDDGDEEWEEGEDDNSEDEYSDDNKVDVSVQEKSREDERSEDDLMNCKSEYGEEDGHFEQEIPLSSSSNKENEFSMDPSANFSRNRMPTCVALRTRSSFKMTSGGIMKAGTFSNPCCLDSDEDDQKIAMCDNSSHGESHKRRVSSASKAGVKSMQMSEGEGEELDRPPGRKLINHADDTGKIQLANSARGNGNELKQKSNGQGKESVTPSKRKHIPRACDARKVLLEAIWGQRDTLHESVNIVTPKVARITSRIFTFGEEDSEPPEKTEAELEFDQLWKEFEFCLRSCEVESGNLDTVENGNLQQPILDPCLRGDHDAILDEEIGFRCRRCSFIIQEIRDVVAPFRNDPIERYVKRDNRRGDDNFLRKLTNENKINDLDDSLTSNHDGTVWDLVPTKKSTLYPHQQEGFEFIWKNIAGAVNLSEVHRLKESNIGSGCIISHAPGTGKSRLAIVFLQAYLTFFPECRPVIIAPKSMLLTWEQEFKKWNVDIPFHNLNNDELSGKEDVGALGVLARLNRGSPRKEILRMVKLYSWKCQSSILGISYNLFEKLTLGRNTEEEDQSEGNALLKLPGLLVLDEGHTARNNDSLIWQALSNVRTEKRICLSGTPFQNNFDELFNTFCMARPGFASTMSLRNKGNGIRRRRPKSDIVKANWTNLTNSICENNIKELENLKAMISPFVHVYKGNVLQDTLPGLSQRVVYLRPGSLQKSLLRTADAIRNVIERRRVASLVSVHPSLLVQQSSAIITRLFPGIREELQETKLTTQDGAKTKFLLEFLRFTDALKEKVLVFSDYIDPLMFLKDQLKSSFGWTEGEEILYMDGKLEVRQRQASISTFNEEGSNVKVLLASTRACCEGISLIGASRVILLDTAWNPSVQRQAISRAYRIGQKRFVYVYYLITYGTVEEQVYQQQVNKDRLSNMVFPLAEGSDIDKRLDSVHGREDKILLEMLTHPTISDSIEKVV